MYYLICFIIFCSGKRVHIPDRAPGEVLRPRQYSRDHGRRLHLPERGQLVHEHRQTYQVYLYIVPPTYLYDMLAFGAIYSTEFQGNIIIFA